MSLRYGVWDGRSATITNLLSRSRIDSASIAADSHDHVHIAFIAHDDGDPNYSLLYATNSGGLWNFSVVANYTTYDRLFFTRIGLDGLDRVYIAAGLAREVGALLRERVLDS